ncbi:MAG: hypothetical protein Q8P89_01945 [bacterium]|nr:hypothetical protein [bacterium]
MDNADNLPHFSRFFSAGFWQQIMWVFLAIFLFVFLLATSLSADFDQSRLRANDDYQNPKAHLDLAEKYLSVNNLENARRELLIGLSFNPENTELQKALTEVENRINQPRRVKEEIENWEKIAQDFPGYRDAYLKLAHLYYSVYQNDQSRQNLKKTLELDPNFEPAQEMEKILGD